MQSATILILNVKDNIKDANMNLLKSSKLFLLIIPLILTIGCSTYNVKVPIRTEYNSYINHIIDTQRYVIVHIMDTSLHFYNIEFDSLKQEFKGLYEMVEAGHQFQMQTNSQARKQHIKKYGNPINDTHLYSTASTDFTNKLLVLPMSSIGKIIIYGQKTDSSPALPLLILVGLIIGFSLLALQSSSLYGI